MLIKLVNDSSSWGLASTLAIEQASENPSKYRKGMSRLKDEIEKEKM